ncbi:hypothetical protein Sm713_14240 [Streptomyces sp. TS71-3]|nr:hypothetical protein Sm713_14240 [Streptomyces sp. TS71-3]
MPARDPPRPGDTERAKLVCGASRAARARGPATRGDLRHRAATGPPQKPTESAYGRFDLPVFDGLYRDFTAVRSMKFCARTAHTTVTEKYDGNVAHTALGRIWEAA